MPRVVGIDHLVLSVGDLARSKTYYNKVLGFLGFRLKHDLGGFAGWSNGKTLFWIAQADAQGRKRKHRKGDIGFHHYAFELASRKAVDDLGAFLDANRMTVADPPGRLVPAGAVADHVLAAVDGALVDLAGSPPGRALRNLADLPLADRAMTDPVAVDGPAAEPGVHARAVAEWLVYDVLRWL